MWLRYLFDMKVTDFVATGNLARLTRIRDNELHYEVASVSSPQTTLRVTIPISETNGAEFLPAERAVYLTRWIRRAIQTVVEGGMMNGH